MSRKHSCKRLEIYRESFQSVLVRLRVNYELYQKTNINRMCSMYRYKRIECGYAQKYLPDM